MHSCWKRWQLEQRPSGFWSKPEQRICKVLAMSLTVQIESCLLNNPRVIVPLAGRRRFLCAHLASSAVSACNGCTLPRSRLTERHVLRSTSSIILLISSIIPIWTSCWSSVRVLLVSAGVRIPIGRLGILRVVMVYGWKGNIAT
jgi:hypothetical protein